MDEPTLAELFARDPFEYSKQDLDRIIAEYREKRKLFNLGVRDAGKTAGKPSLSDVLKEAGML
jgi:hypothetical protein